MSVYDDFPKVDGYGREVVVLSSAIDSIPVSIPVTIAGGGSDATAANQTTEIARLTSIVSNTAISTVGPTNGTKTVPTGSAEAVSGSVAATKGVLVISDSANSAIIYVGGSAVTTSNGVDLNPGDARFYEVNNGNLIYCISSTSSQVLRYEVL